jgi:hypothetical protein
MAKLNLNLGDGSSSIEPPIAREPSDTNHGNFDGPYTGRLWQGLIYHEGVSFREDDTSIKY